MSNLPEWKIELYRPFALSEHRFSGKRDTEDAGNVYLLKGAIRRRLDRVLLLDWNIGRPELISVTNDTVIMTTPLIIHGQAHWGLGTGKIQRFRKDQAGKPVEIDAYALTVETAKAFKSAVSDCLTRAAYEHGIGWYLRDIPMAWKSKIGTRDGFNEYLDHCLHIFLKAHGDPQQAKASLQSEDEMSESADGAGQGASEQEPPFAVTPPPQVDKNTGEKAVVPISALWPKVDFLFTNKSHFEASYQKHQHDLAGLTLAQAVEYYKKLHWNFDKTQVTPIHEIGISYGLNNDSVLAALARVTGKAVKSWRDWDGGDPLHAQAALLIGAANYVPAKLEQLVSEKAVPETVADLARQYYMNRKEKSA